MAYRKFIFASGQGALRRVYVVAWLSNSLTKIFVSVELKARYWGCGVQGTFDGASQPRKNLKQMEKRVAGFWIRAGADLIDSFILNLTSIGLQLMILGLIFWIQILFSLKGANRSFFESFHPYILQIMLLSLRIALSIVYFVWLTYRYGASLGKRLLGIRVVSAVDYSSISLSQSISRCLGYALSYSLLGLGFLFAAFHPKKQALHDLIAETVSVR